MAVVSKSHAMLNGLCPQCRTGKIFAYPFSNLTKFDQMHEKCPNCGLRYEIEPGYFIGAMYVSYAVSGGVALVLSFALYFLAGDPPGWVYATVVIIAMILIVPMNFRASRVVWLYYVAGIQYRPGFQTTT